MPAVAAHTIKKGHYVMIDGFPCKITKVMHTKTGKHGHIKVNMWGVCVITGQKLETVRAGHMDVQTPTVQREDYDLLSIEEKDEGAFHLLNAKNQEVIIDLPASELRAQLIAARQADTDCNKTFSIVLMHAPMIVGGRLVQKRALSAWRGSANDDE